jgi:hypothetical protein
MHSINIPDPVLTHWAAGKPEITKTKQIPTFNIQTLNMSSAVWDFEFGCCDLFGFWNF